jgi:hypothetical protein
VWHLKEQVLSSNLSSLLLELDVWRGLNL